MKLRIRGNSIRLRLLQTEVAALAKNGFISEKINFGNTVFIYSLRVSQETTEISAEFNENEISIFLPEDAAKDWTENDTVGLSAEQKTDADSLKILIEKDFVCLDRKDDPDNADAFPHPSTNC
jgi:hypothetical protein